MKKKKILLFCTGWGNELLFNYATGIKEALSDYNADLYVILCYPSYTDEESVQKGELNIFNLPNMSDFDGALLLGNVLDYKDCFETLVERVKEAGIPCVSTGRTADGIYSVDCDNYPGAHDLAVHLIEKHGVKNPLFIAGQSNNPDSNTRLRALKDAMVEHGLTLPSSNVFYSKWEPQLAYFYVIDLMTSKDKEKPDAIICANDPLAMAVCQALREHNIEVPRDIIVTGFDNDYFAQIYDPSMCDVDQDFRQLGYQSLKTLMDIINGKERLFRQKFPSKFIPSESCGCCEVRDFSAMRKNLGRNKFSENMGRAIFARSLRTLEAGILSGEAYEDIRKNFAKLYEEDKDFIRDSFHVVLEPLYSKTISNPMRKMLSKGYSHKMDVVFSAEHGHIITNDHFDSSEIVPQIDEGDDNRIFLVLPLHEKEQNFGYVIFCDDLDLIKDSDSKLFNYVTRMSNVLAKYKQTLSMNLLNQRLLELTETDALTRAKNRVAYEEKEKELNTQIRVSKKLQFAIAMFDVNNLKKVNDEYGHDAGDEYIINCCHLVCNHYKKSPVYRMGGDEFAAILVGEDFEQRDVIFEELQKAMKELAREELPICDRLSVAGGIAVYNPETDKTVLDVYNRADDLMYENKVKMKGKGNVR